MLLSVIIPTCNRNDLLGKCLDCLQYEVQQLDSSIYEVIVTDDGRNNEAKQLVEKNYPWVQWVEGPKKGPAANRNNGAKYAKGEWSIFIDDDCEPDATLINGYLNAINDKETNVYEGRIYNAGLPQSPFDYAPVNEHGGNLWSCNFMIRAKLFRDLHGFDENFIYAHMEDIDFKKRIVNAGEKIIFTPAASVMHPWRHVANGIRLGKQECMYVYYHVKHHMQINLINWLRSIFIFHFNMFKRANTAKEYLKIITDDFLHLTIVCVNYLKWKIKYNRLSRISGVNK